MLARVCALSTTRGGQDAAAEADHKYGELVSPSLARLLPRDTCRLVIVTRCDADTDRRSWCWSSQSDVMMVTEMWT